MRGRLDQLIALAQSNPRIGLTGPMSDHPPPQRAESAPARYGNKHAGRTHGMRSPPNGRAPEGRKQNPLAESTPRNLGCRRRPTSTVHRPTLSMRPSFGRHSTRWLNDPGCTTFLPVRVIQKPYHLFSLALFPDAPTARDRGASRVDWPRRRAGSFRWPGRRLASGRVSSRGWRGCNWWSR